MACLDMFINIPPGEDTDTRPYFAKRSTMMTNILKKMRREMEESKNSSGKAELSAAFDKLWETVWEKRIINISATKERHKN